MKRATIKILFTLIVILTLYSCDKVFNYNFQVENNTNKELTVIFKTGNEIYNYFDTIKVEKNTKELIFIDGAAGGRKLEGVNIKIIFETFVIKLDTLDSKINYRNNEQWDYTEITDVVGEYTLDVDSTHFY